MPDCIYAATRPEFQYARLNFYGFEAAVAEAGGIFFNLPKIERATVDVFLGIAIECPRDSVLKI